MSLKIRKGDKMEYRYKEIYLEETIEEIFPELNNSNTEYEPSTFSLAYRPYEYVEKITKEIYDIKATAEKEKERIMGIVNSAL